MLSWRGQGKLFSVFLLILANDHAFAVMCKTKYCVCQLTVGSCCGKTEDGQNGATAWYSHGRDSGSERDKPSVLFSDFTNILIQHSELCVRIACCSGISARLSRSMRHGLLLPSAPLHRWLTALLRRQFAIACRDWKRWPIRPKHVGVFK